MKEMNMSGMSKNILEENISKLKELFPEILSEDKIDFDKLKLLLSDEIDNSPERYNFTWNEKSKTIFEAQKPSVGTLRPVKEESKDEDTTHNLYIEGDNLEVLKLLQKSYYNKIKMIYIDPPYNTGKDFVYPDNYKDNLENYLEISGQGVREDSLSQVEKSENSNKLIKISTNTENKGRFHTNWLNLIYPRLRLARNLLAKEGVIFISIDDNEVFNLKKVCDEIFGEENFVSTFIRKSGVSARLDSKFISTENDYILLYCKNINTLELNQEKPPEDKSYKLKDDYYNKRGGYKLNKLDRGSINYSKSLDYPIESPDKTLIYPGGTKEMNGWCWRWSREKFQWGLQNDFIVIKKGNTGWSVYFKQYEFVDNNDNPLIRTIPYKNMLIDNFFNEYGNRLIKDLFKGSGFFDYPKPVELIIHLLKIIKSENSIILDFFSGSSTTAHAVMKLNSEDKGNRKFFMIQFPEPIDEKSEAFKAGYKTIAEIGKERIRRAGDKIKSESNNNDLDVGFKVFKLDSSNLNKWNPDYNNLEQTLIDTTNNLVSGRTELDLVYEIMLKYGIDLTLPVEEYEINDKKVYSIGFGALLICLDDNITKKLAIPLIELKNKLSPEISRVVFKDNGFASDSDKTNIKETLKTNNINEFITI